MNHEFAQETSKKIPVHSLWVGNSLSTLEVLSIRSHIKVGHEYTLWSYQPVENTPQGVIIKDAREVMPECDVFAYEVGEGTGSYSACSNLFRYKLLSVHDVWWVDTDVVALKPFHFKEPTVFASERNRNGSSSPTTCVIKMSPMVARDCYKLACSMSSDRAKLRWSTIGPKLLTQIIFTWPLGDLSQYVQPPHVFCPVDWFAAEFDPVVHNPPSVERSHAVHMWHEMWRRRGLNKNDSFEPNCLFERLKNDVLQP